MIKRVSWSKNVRNKLLILLLVLLTFGAGLATADYLRNKQVDDVQQRYSLLARRVLAENPNDIILDFNGLQESYQGYLNQRNMTDKVSIYFEYLPTGSSIGINEDKEALGASLIKLPLAVSAYKLAEQGKLDLDQTVSIKKDWLNNSYGNLYEKGEGYKLTYREAIGYALRESDNTAALMLFDAVSSRQGTKSINILSFVDANYDTNPQKEVLIGVQSYSSILKCIYFSCHLEKKDSQEILQFLTKSTATNRLTQYLPESIPVAHKIGTFKGVNQSDCGIVYVPKRNYVLCVMVQASDPEASSIIADLSQLTYKYVLPREALSSE